MRLEISCEDRLGITQDILDILVSHEIDLRGIEIGTNGKIFLNFPNLDFGEFQHLMPEIRRIEGITDVKTTSFMPFEREHQQLFTLIQTLPDPVFSIDVKGNVLVANDSVLSTLELEESDVLGQPIGEWVKGFNFNKWLEGSEVLAQTQKLKFLEQDFLGDIMPTMIPDEDDNANLAGAVIVLKSELRLGKQMSVFHQVDDDAFEQVVATSPVMKRIVKEAKRMSELDAPILLVGETGSGKEILARSCHEASKRSDKPFLVLNCAALPDDVAESELFGQKSEKQGVYSKGIFEQANGGTVFLDEVGDMSPALQVKLIRFLQDGTFRIVGVEQEIHSDVRIMCSTQKDLPAMVQEGSFRQDLYYRLNVLTLHVPPLRERKADIIPLAEFFIKRFSAKLNRRSPKLSKSCVEHLQQYPWPGNIRQLSNALYRSVSLLEGDELSKELLQLPAYASDFGYFDEEFEGTLDEAVKTFEANLLKKLYPAYPSTRQLAKKLGLSHTAIANKLREYGINKDTVKIV